MKRRDFLTIGGASVLLTACSGFSLKELGEGAEGALQLYFVESAAVPIGYYCAQSESLDTAMREIYSLAVEGKLTPEGVNKILEVMGAEDPLAIIMVKRCIRLAELAGATVDGGVIIDLAGIAPEYIEAIATGYVDGYDSYMLTANS